MKPDEVDVEPCGLFFFLNAELMFSFFSAYFSHRIAVARSVAAARSLCSADVAGVGAKTRC